VQFLVSNFHAHGWSTRPARSRRLARCCSCCGSATATRWRFSGRRCPRLPTVARPTARCSFAVGRRGDSDGLSLFGRCPNEGVLASWATEIPHRGIARGRAEGAALAPDLRPESAILFDCRPRPAPRRCSRRDRRGVLGLGPPPSPVLICARLRVRLSLLIFPRCSRWRLRRAYAGLDSTLGLRFASTGGLFRFSRRARLGSAWRSRAAIPRRMFVRQPAAGHRTTDWISADSRGPPKHGGVMGR